MIRALQWQGIIFVCGALLVAASALFFSQLGEQTTLSVLVVLIIVLGVPHGALDTIFLKKRYGVNSPHGWAIAGLSYVILSALVVGVWIVLPAVFLASFLAFSALHFSGDPRPGSFIISRILYGGGVIVLPNLLYTDEVNRLFGLLAGAEASGILTPVLSVLAWPWLVALLLSSALEYRRDPLTAFELVGAGLLSSLAPPLVGFTVFFCLMHSPRHIIRTLNYARPLSLWRLTRAGMVPMVMVLSFAAIAWTRLGEVSVEARVLQIVFVGLAALTVPHMLLVERVRFSGWGSHF